MNAEIGLFKLTFSCIIKIVEVFHSYRKTVQAVFYLVYGNVMLDRNNSLED